MLHQLFDREHVKFYKGLNPDHVSYAKCVEMLAKGRQWGDINCQDESGDTPIHLAAKFGD